MMSNSAESDEGGEEKAKERFIRWQAATQAQLGNVNNLLIGLAAGVTAFELQIIFRESLCLNVVERWILLESFVSLFLSLALGCWTAWNRLLSFRTTTRIARLKQKGSATDHCTEIERLREKADRLDDRTWSLLRWQTVLFGLGMLFLVICAGRRLWGCP